MDVLHKHQMWLKSWFDDQYVNCVTPLVFILLFYYSPLSCYPKYRQETFQSRNVYAGWNSPACVGRTEMVIIQCWNTSLGTNFEGRFLQFLHGTGVKKQHRTWQWGWWAIDCSCVRNGCCEFLAPHAHCESNKIFTFTPNFTFKMLPLSHTGIEFQLMLRLSIEELKVKAFPCKNISTFPTFLTCSI